MPKKIEISHRTIVFTFLLLGLIWLLAQVKDILFSVFISIILTSALNPLICRLEKLKIPRALAILSFYLLFFGVFGVTIAGIIPPLVDQSTILLSNFPKFIENINLPWLDKTLLLNQISQLASLPTRLVNFSVSLFRNLLGILALGVFTFYLLMERKNLDKYLNLLFLDKRQKRIADFVARVENRLGRWVRAQASLMLIVGVFSYLGLRLLGIDFALPLALLAGFLEIVPNIGPTVSAIPAILAGFAISPLHGFAAAILYLFIQQLENNLIVPKVMQKGLGVNPLITLIVLAVGLQLAGIMGMILALPLFLFAQEIVIEFLSSSLSQK